MVFGEKRINALVSAKDNNCNPADSDFIISSCLEELRLCLTGFRLRNLKSQDLFVFYNEI